MAAENKVVSKLEALPREELVKFVKKQAISSKELKKKIADLSEQLNIEHNEVIRLEKEKKDWISRGVTAEFEKKEKLVKKDRELELAAKLGKEMLAENDVLQDQIDELKRDHDDTIQSFEDELEKTIQEKEVLEKTMTSIHEEFIAAKEEAEQCRVALQVATDIHEKDIKTITAENKELQERVQDLEHQLNTSTANLKLHKLKEKYEESLKENKYLKELLANEQEEHSKKAEIFSVLENNHKILKKNIMELEKQKKADSSEIDSFQAKNNQLLQSLQLSQEKNQQIDEELQKIKAEKEKQLKALKNTKSKLQKALQAEEDVKKQLVAVTADRDQLLKKKTKKTQKKNAAPKSSSVEFENDDSGSKLLEEHVMVLETENKELHNNTDNLTDENEVLKSYKRLQKDFEHLSFEVDELNATITSLQEESRQQKKENEELTHTNQDLMKQYELLDFEKNKECKSMKENIKENHSANKEINSLKNKMKELKETNENYEDIEETKATIVKLESRLNELVNQLQTLNEEKHHQECELEELFKSHDDLQNKYDFECQERQKRESEVHHLEQRIVKLENSEIQNKVTADLEEQIGCLEQQLADSHQDRDRHKHEILIKEQHITQLRSEIHHLNQKQSQSNAANNKEVDSIVHEFEQLDRQLTATKKELELSLKEKADYEKVTGELQNEKKEIKEMMKILIEKLMDGTENKYNRKCIQQVKELHGIEELNILSQMIDGLLISQEETLQKNNSLQSELDSLMIDNQSLNQQENVKILQLSDENSRLQNSFDDLNIKFHEKEETARLIEKELHFYHDLQKEAGCKNGNEFQNYILELKKEQNCNHELNPDNEAIDGKLLRDSPFNDDIPFTVMKELEQCKRNYQSVEEELQSALNRTDDLELQLSAKQEELESLQHSLHENESKNNKYRSFALKAKREIESCKALHENERKIIEDKMKHLLEENRLIKEELVQQKTECGKHEEEFEVGNLHEEEFEEFQKEIQSLKESIHMEHECVTKLKKENEDLRQKLEEMLIDANTLQNEGVEAQKEREQEKEALVAEKLKIEENLQQKIEQVDHLKERVESLQSTLTNSQKQETQKLALMNLEIQDYQRTIETSQNKLLDLEKTLNDSKVTIDRYSAMQETSNQQISTLTNEKEQFEEKTKKLKSYVIKLKKELEDNEILNTQKTDEVEELKQKVDEAKIELAEMANAKNSLIEQLNTTLAANKKSTQTLEVNFARVSTDLMTLQNTHAKLQEEYETYKVRAHNVLKQRKNVPDVDHSETECKHLRETSERLKNKLEETIGKLNLLESEYSELKNEHDGLLTTYDQIVTQIKANEVVWKERLESFKKETRQVLEINTKLKDENQHLTKKCMEKTDELGQMEEKYNNEIAMLKEQQKQHEEGEPTYQPRSLTLELEKQQSVESTKTDNSFAIHRIERQEGEGMDQKELELIDTLSNSAPQTPKSPTHVAILEKLLSPATDIHPHLSSPQTPASLREELFNFQSALSVAVKKNEHVTALLRESEANAMRLDDQAKVLKEEIRRLERNEEREQALSNLEYLKNVIIKFLKVGHLEREQLIPVLTTMLKLSREEKQFIVEYSKGEHVDSEEQTNTWSSYVYRWTSLS